jgi:hypothetical protein
LDRRARPILIYLAAFILLSATLFHWLEGWGWLDSIYFVIIIFTPIGYGDLSPTAPLTKLLTIFVGLNGIAILLLFLEEIRCVRAWHRPDHPEEADTAA